jgi:hypothetical protein
MKPKTRIPSARDDDTKHREPTSKDQSGSAGRSTSGATQPGKDSGQGHYGQSGFGGKHQPETDGETKYHESEHDGDPGTKGQSNRGSGHADADETTKDIPKTGSRREP